MDRLLRRQAEFDNFRRRAERERADVLEFAHTESVRAILADSGRFRAGAEDSNPPTKSMRAAWS